MNALSARWPLTVLCLLLMALAAPVALGRRQKSEPSARVGQWDRFEAEVANRKVYADPYRDVSLDVVYTRPDSGTVRFWGFYDGGQRWRIRFMPDELGTWRYAATFSDGSPGARGEFRCVPSDLPGMLSIDERNPLWFGYRGGKPLLVRSFHVGDRFFAANWSERKRQAFLDWLQGQGYNMLSVASHYLNRAAPGRGEGWETPRLWPLNAGGYRKMEAVLDDLRRRRILVYPFAGFFGRASEFPRSPEDQTLYLRYTLARLGPSWNLLFNLAGPEPNLRGKPYLSDEEVNRLGREIRRLDPFGHPLSVHNRTGDDPYRDADWSTYGTLQGPKTLDRARLSAGLLESHHPRKPLYAQETLWSGNQNHPRYSDDDLRKNAWVVMLSAAALNYGDMNGDSSSGFSGTLELADRVQVRHDIVTRVWDFFETLPFHRMAPHQELVDRGYCLAEPGSRYLVYLPEGGAASVKVAPGAYGAEWINGQNPADRRDGGTTHDGRNLQAPPGGDDWLLSLARAAPAEEKGGAPVETYFPPPDAQGGWRTARTPEEVRRTASMDVRKLDEAFAVAESSTKNGGLLVVRHGWLVYERYFGLGYRDATPNLASCAKSFTSIAAGILMGERPERFPDGLDQKVFAPGTLPPEAFPLADPARAEIKLGQLLAFSAGIRGNNPGRLNGKEVTLDPPGPDGWPATVDAVALGQRDIESGGQLTSTKTLWCRPGEGYSYATSSIHLVSMVVRHVSGMELEEYVRRKLATPMGWGRFGWGYRFAREVTHTPGGGGIAVRATDMLRFGYLLLHDGRWGDRQLVPAAYVRHCRRQSPYNPHAPYSLQFDVNTDGHYPEYPRDAFWKSGSGAHMLYVVPSLDLVVWKLAGRDGQYQERDTGLPLDPEVARKAAESRKDWQPTLGEREGQRLLLQKVIEAIVAPGGSAGQKGSG